MAVYQGQASVGTVATVLNSSRAQPGVIHIVNQDNTDTVYVGGEAITTSTGHGIPKSGDVELTIYADTVIYAISTKTGHTVTWLHITP
jgi:hypothetical protein